MCVQTRSLSFSGLLRSLQSMVPPPRRVFMEFQALPVASLHARVSRVWHIEGAWVPIDLPHVRYCYSSESGHARWTLTHAACNAATRGQHCQV